MIVSSPTQLEYGHVEELVEVDGIEETVFIHDPPFFQGRVTFTLANEGLEVEIDGDLRGDDFESNFLVVKHMAPVPGAQLEEIATA